MPKELLCNTGIKLFKAKISIYSKHLAYTNLAYMMQIFSILKV